MTTTTEFTTISISVNGVWAGSGKVINGRITDCGAQFCRDTDESENVYELIEAEMLEGRDSLRVETEDGSIDVTWSIELSDDDRQTLVAEVVLAKAVSNEEQMDVPSRATK